MKDKLESILTHFDIPADLKKDFMEGKKELTDITTVINDNYISRKLAKDDEDIKSGIIGNMTGTINSKLKGMFDLTKGDMEGKKVEEIVQFGLDKKLVEVESLKTKITELESNDQNDTITKLQDDLVKAGEKTKGVETQLMEANKTIEEKEKGWGEEKKNIQIDLMVKDEKSKVPFRDDRTELDKIGFEAEINQNYKWGIGEKEEEGDLIIFDSKGNRIKNDKGSAYMKPDEILLMEGAKHKQLKMNNAEPPKKTSFNEDNKGKKIHKNAQV